MNKTIKRSEEAKTVFDRRSLAVDYRHLKAILKEGMTVLDIGCGTGAITKDIAKIVGPTGKVIGIDNTYEVIEHGNIVYADISNLELKTVDLFNFETKEKFDLIVGARVLQWMTTVKEALQKVKSLLKEGGQVSFLDYNHNRLEWVPQPPLTMRRFYQAFLNWRKDAGINNAIGTDLPHLLKEVGFKDIEVVPSHELYDHTRKDFDERVKIWSQVAGLEQITTEGYLSERDRLRAIEDYNKWVEEKAVSMTMFLNEVRGRI
ncbi:methyltransferase domain-containing protein [Flammeovirga sp. OC4]|uniref:methyltransferase domain-containing protein n=1 Tax=Flammeovirga sp. OC4 TaxID=1382345 RepID=UPI0005C5861D|nr:methyltransferase domain-containing protein [Flammeovirga sp. OC4]